MRPLGLCPSRCSQLLNLILGHLAFSVNPKIRFIYKITSSADQPLNPDTQIEKGNHGSSTIEPVLEHLLGTIKKGDKANLNYILADSEKGKADHKYLFGNAKAETWIGVLAAEKSDEKPAENSTGK